MSTLKIVGIGGSLADSCSSSAALRAALASAAGEGAETELFLIRELDLPMYSEGTQTPPEAALRLAGAVASAHGLIWASPLYHGSVSGAFKNAIDWLQLLYDHKPAYLTGKVVGLISAAGGVQALQAINTMEQIVRSLRGFTYPFTVPIAHAGKVFGPGGEVLDEKVAQQLAVLGRDVAHSARRMAGIAE